MRYFIAKQDISHFRIQDGQTVVYDDVYLRSLGIGKTTEVVFSCTNFWFKDDMWHFALEDGPIVVLLNKKTGHSVYPELCQAILHNGFGQVLNWNTTSVNGGCFNVVDAVKRGETAEQAVQNIFRMDIVRHTQSERDVCKAAHASKHRA